MKVLRLLRLLVSLILIAGMDARTAISSRPGDKQAPDFILLVDTTIDSNAASYQRCRLRDPVDCSLRGAISFANSQPEASFTILLPAEAYHLTLPGTEDQNQAGDLDVYGNLLISGDGTGETFINAGSLERVFHFFPGASAAMHDLIITGGRAAPGEPGGGIFNLGSLVLENVVVTANLAGDGRTASSQDLDGQAGGTGGGIENRGSLILHGCLVSDNRAGKGGDTLPEFPGYPAQTGGSGGGGGGLANQGTLEIYDSIIAHNQAGAGGLGTSTYQPPWSDAEDHQAPAGADVPTDDSIAGNGGDGGSGGGIHNQGLLKITRIKLVGNLAGPGGAGGNAFIFGGIGGKGGDGGGISNLGQLDGNQVIVIDNQSGPAGPSGWSDYKAGEAGTLGPGHAGGLFNAGRAGLLSSQVSGNSTAPAHLGYSSYSLADGGGLYNAPAGSLSLRDTLVRENQASGAGGGIFNQADLEISGGQVDGNQARRLGGGIHNSGWLQAYSFSISYNTSGPGYDGFPDRSFYGGPSMPANGETPGGGGLFNLGHAWLAAVNFDQNWAGDGGKGGDVTLSWFPGGDGGSGGFGGGIYNQGQLEIYLSNLTSNHTGQGGLGGNSQNGNGLNGTGGPGGGIYNSGLMLAGFLTIQGNFTGPGATAVESGGQGGGFANNGTVSLYGSTVALNQTSVGGSGGGIAVLGCPEDVLNTSIAISTILDNQAGGDGGGLFLSSCDMVLANLVVAGNHVDEARLGSGLFQADRVLILRHLTIASNSSGDGSGFYQMSGTSDFTNTIFAGQPVGLYLGLEAHATLHTTLWGAGSWANGLDWDGPGDLDLGSQNPHADPLFIDPAHGDFHLSGLSPAIDSGSPSGLDVDLDDQPRPAPGSSLPDIGADEAWSLVELSGLAIVKPERVTTGTPAIFRLEFIPPQASPNIQVLWAPPPRSGLGTSEAEYIFEQQGEQVITAWAVQAGRMLSATAVVSVQAGAYRVYFPLVWR